MQMQKYIITDGKNYIKQVTKNGTKRVSTPSFAVELSFEKARKVLLEYPDMNGYYLEGVEDFMKTTRSELLQSKQDIMNDAENALTETMSSMSDIENLVEGLCKIQMPDKKALLTDKNRLLDGLQWADTARSEIDHWIRHNQPPAHIRTKVYGYWRKYSQKHEEIKEKLRYIDILLDFSDNKISYREMVKRLKDAKNKPYKPRTELYKQLNELLCVNNK